MAAPITHIALADKVFDKYFKKFEKKDFYIGCVFPDIRNLGVIEREKTHVRNMTLRDVLDAPSAFRAGVLYHALVDEVLQRFMVSSNINEICPQSYDVVKAVKLVEDTLFYPYVTNWGEICQSFDTVLPEELAYGISKEMIEKWHTMIMTYCQKPPTPKSVETFMFDLGIAQIVVDEINAMVLQIKNIPEVREIAIDFWNQFDDILESGI